MANVLVERLKALESRDKFRGATEEQQRGVRQKFVAKHLETDLKFLALPGEAQQRVRDKFLNRPFPKPPITAARSVDVALQAITGATDPRLAAFPVAQAVNIASTIISGGGILPAPDPATPDELSQLDPSVAQFIGTFARLRLGVEKGTLALGGLAPPIQRLLKDRFATQEDLVQAIENAGGISTVRAAVTGLVGELAGASAPIVAGAKLLNRARGGVEALKKLRITAGGAGLPARITGGGVTAGGEAVGATRVEPLTSPPLTEIPGVGPAFEKLAELGGPPSVTGEPTLQQEAVAFGAGFILGAPAAGLIPGRTTRPAVKVPVDDAKPQTGVTSEMQTPVATEVSKLSTLPPNEAKAAVLDFITGKSMSEPRRQVIVDALAISDDLAATPAGEVVASRIAREDSLRPESVEVDVIPVPDRTSAARRGGVPSKGEQVTIIIADQQGREIKSLKFVEGERGEFVRMGGAEAAGKDPIFRNVASEVIAEVNAGNKISQYLGTSDRIVNKLMDGIDTLADGRIPRPDAGKVQVASKLTPSVAKQLVQVQHPSKVGKRGAGVIKRIATESEAKLVALTLRNRGFVAREVATDGQSGNFHVIWNIETGPAFDVAGMLIRKSEVDPTLKTPDGSQGGLTPQERTAVKVNEANTDAASKILKVGRPGRLAPDLVRSKPRFNIGRDAFLPKFQSEVDLALFIVAQKIPSKRNADFLGFLKTHSPESSVEQIRQAGLEVREQIKTIAKQSKGGTPQKPAIIDIPQTTIRPRAGKASKKPSLPASAEVALPDAALATVTKAAKDASLRINKAVNVVEIADKAGIPLRRVEFGKDRIITNPTAAIAEANSIVAKIKSGTVKPEMLRAQSIIAKVIDDVIEEADGFGITDVAKLTQAGDIVRNLDMATPDARAKLNEIRGAFIGGDELQNFIRSPDDFAVVNDLLGDTSIGPLNNLEDVVTAVNDSVVFRSKLRQDRPDPPDIPRTTERAKAAIEGRAQGQYVDDLVKAREDIADLQKMVNDGSAARLLKNTADRLSDTSLPSTRNPMQGHKITAEVMDVGPNKTKAIVVHDVALNETQKFPFDGRGVADALNYIESGVKRLSCVLCPLGKVGVVTGENQVSVFDHRAGTRAIFPSFAAVMRWARTQVGDSRTGPDVKFPDDIPVEALGKWGETNYGASRGTLGSPMELAPAIIDEIPALRQVAGIVDPIKSWMQGIENAFPQLPVFSQIWEPVEAGALAARQWSTARYADLARLSRGTGDDQAQGMQVMWMMGLKNKGAAAQIKNWYRLSEQDLAKGEQFRRKLIDSGNDHGLNIDNFMQDQLPKIMQNRGLIDQAFPNEIPKESLFFRSAFREDEISARHIDIRDLSLRLTRMMAKETFIRPAIDVAEAMMDRGLNNVKGLAGPVRQYLDAQVGIPPESRIKLQNIIRDIWVGGVESVQKNVVKRIGTTQMDEAFSRHLENVKTQDLIGPWVDWHLANVYGALMAWRPGVVIRNMPQTMLTILPRVGPKAWALGMRDALTEGGWDAPRKAGAIDDVLPLAFSEEIAESVTRPRFGKSIAGKLFAKTQSFTNTGLVAFSAVDRFHRATAYHAMKHLVQASTKAAPDVWARTKSGLLRSSVESKRLDDVSEAIGIDMFGPIVQEQANALLAKGSADNLISYLGRNLAEDTQWIYRKGNQAGIGRGVVGKIFFNFSTWPTWFGRYAFNLTTQGTRRNRMKAIATFAAVNEGLFLAGREVFGVDASHWLYWHPLNYGGGTNLEAAVALTQAEFLETPNNRDSFQQRKARRVLETYWQRQVPGFGAGKDVYRFFGANSPGEAARKATGFPEAGPRSLSVGERVLSVAGVETGQAGRQGRRDVELVPLP